jgi:hypothetical protein
MLFSHSCSSAPSQIPSLVAMRRALGFVLDPKSGVLFGGTRDKEAKPRLVAAALESHVVAQKTELDLKITRAPPIACPFSSK